jgi:hypothetical protein
MSIAHSSKYSWDDATSAAPHWKTFCRHHTTELQRKEIAFVNDSVICDAVMDSKQSRLLGEPAVPILAGTPAQNNEARKNFSFAENRWSKSKTERTAWRAEQSRFIMKSNLALASFEDFFEATSTIGVFIAKQEKEVSTFFAASQDNWLAAIALHVQDPLMAAQQAAANVPAQDYWQDKETHLSSPWRYRQPTMSGEYAIRNSIRTPDTRLSGRS